MATSMKARLRRRRRHLVQPSDHRLIYRVANVSWPWFFGALVSLVAFVPARYYALAVGNGAALLCLRVWVACVAIAGTLRLGFNLLRARNSSWQRFYERAPKWLHGLQYCLAGGLAGLFVIGLAVFRFPYAYLWTAWPLMVPGMVIMVHRFSLDDKPGAFPRPVTQRALFYAVLAAITLLFAAASMPPGVPGTGSTLFGRLTEYALPSALAFGVLIGIYALMRQSDLARLQAEMVTGQFERVIQQDNYTRFWGRIAKSIQLQFRLYRVVIITPDDHYHDALCAATEVQRIKYLGQVRFCIEEVVGDGSESLETHDYPARGIALSVLNSARSKIIANVAQHRTEYFENGLWNTRSELYVPVLDLEHNREVIAIIVAQDSHRWAFTHIDRMNLERVADYLATFSRHLSQNNNYGRLQDMATKLEAKTDVGREDLLNAACTVFRTKTVAYIPLAFATYRPLLADAVANPEGFAELFRTNDAWLDARSGIPDLIRTWQPLLITDFDQDDVARFWRDWAGTQKLQALALVPIGAKSGTGALFLIGFRQSLAADERHLRALAGAFANSLAQLIDHSWQHWWTYETVFVAPTVEVHQLLNRYSLSRDSIDTTIATATNGDLGVLQSLCTNIKALVTDLYDMEAVSSPLGNLRRLLSRALDQFSNSLQGRYALSGVRLIDDRIEDESLELKSMLYRIICEAMLNALSHGGASTVNVIAARKRDCILLLVQDDGKGFDPGELALLGEHRHGIVALCRRLSELTGAPALDWLWTARDRGACLKISVPCLALGDQDDASDSDIEQKLRRLEELYGQSIES